MKKRIFLSYLLFGFLATTFSSCYPTDESEETPVSENKVEEVEDIIEPEDNIDIDLENDDEVRDEGEVVGSQEEQKFKYTYDFSTNFMDVFDTSVGEHTFEVGESLSTKLSSVTTSLIKNTYDDNGNKTDSNQISINSNSLKYYLNGRAINTSYTFNISDIGVQMLTLSVNIEEQVFYDSFELLVYSNENISEESSLSIATYPRRKFLINSNIDFSNLRIAKQTTYSGDVEEFTLTKILNSEEYGLLVDDQRYSSSKVYTSTGTHTVKVFYADPDEELESKSDSELVSYFNDLDSSEKLTFTFQVFNQNEINELVIDSEMVINKSYGIGDSLDFTSLNLNYYTEKKSSKESKANSKSVKPLFNGEYKIKHNGSEISKYVFNSTNPVRFDIEVTASNLSKETSSFIISPIFDNVSIINNYDDSEDTLNMTFTRNTQNSSIASLNPANDKGYFSPEEVENIFAVRDYSSKTYACPSKGKVPLIIVPVVFPTSSRAIGVGGYSSKDYASYATSNFWDAIYKSFFGKEGEGELDSLRSYYYKSSYGQLDLCGLMTDYCFVDELSDLDSTTLTNIKDGKDFNRTNLSYSIGRWVKSNYNIDSNYDSDGDEVSDAFIYVWIGPRTSSITSYWDSTRVGTIDYKNKEVVSYLWTSALNTFPYTSSGDYSSAKFRTAIITHEFGHLIGAFDLYPSTNTYYSYSKNRDPQLEVTSSSSSAQYKYAPMGYYDQMDHDVGDHNMYNKMLFGWIKPYIVYGTNVTLDLKSIQHINSAILVYDDDKIFVKNSNGKIVFSPFDEYLVVDYYTNKNLNKDKEVKQYSISPLQGYGGRICHVDARLYASGSYINDCSTLVKNKRSYVRKNKNTYSSDNSYFEEIRWIQSTAFLTCKSISKSYTNYALSPNSFFISGGTGANKEFSITGKASTYDQSYSQSFVNGKESKMNNGKVNSSKITFNSLVYL